MLRRPTAVKAVIIDHWPMLRLGVNRVLQLADIRVVGEAATAVEGVRLIRAEKPDLVLLGDHVGTEVRDVVGQIKALPGGAKVLALVGQADRAQVTELLAAGADGLLVRSVGPEELTDAIARSLDGERIVSPSLIPLVVHAATTAGAAPVPTAFPSTGVGLTAKEREVLAQLADGRSNSEIAAALFVTPATVKSHLAHIYAKLEVKGRHQALARAIALGYLR